MIEDSDAPDATGGPAVSVAARRVIAAVLGLLLVAAIATFVGLSVSGASSPTGIFDKSSSSEDQKDRQQVMAQTQQFMARVNTYGPDLLAEDGTMPEYRDKVLAVITSKLAESFEQTVTAAEATVAQAGFARTTEIFGVGVAAIDEDSATALIAGAFTNSYPKVAGDFEGERQDDVPLPFRVEVKLVKVEGKWLVDSFVPVTGDEATGGGADPSGSATPSEGSSETSSESPTDGGSS